MNKKVLAVLVIVAIIAGAVAFYFANPDFLQGRIDKKIKVEAVKKAVETKAKKELVEKKAKKELIKRKGKKEVTDTVSKDIILRKGTPTSKKEKKEYPQPEPTNSGSSAPATDGSDLVPTI